eukprot:Nk52_evm1s237 gene=Nk52_evmTU1s237
MFRKNSSHAKLVVAMMAALVLLCVAATRANPVQDTTTEVHAPSLGNRLGNAAEAEKYCKGLGGKWFKIGNAIFCKDIRSNSGANCNTFCSMFSASAKPAQADNCPAKNKQGELWISCVTPVSVK